MRFTNPCTFDGRPLATVELLNSVSGALFTDLTNVSGSLNGSIKSLQDSLSAFQGGNGYLASVASSVVDNKVAFTKGDGSQVEVDFASLVKVANDSESFITVDGNVIKLAGVQTAIDTAKQAAMTAASSDLASAKTELEGKISAAGTKAAEDLASAQSVLEGKINDAVTGAASNLASAKADLEGQIATARQDLSGYIDTEIAALGNVFELKGYADKADETKAPWEVEGIAPEAGDVYLVKETQEIKSTNDKGETVTETVEFVAEYVYIGGEANVEGSYEQIGGSVAGGNVGGYATVTYADTVATAAKEAAIAYTDEQIALVNADIEAVSGIVDANKAAIEGTVSALTQTVADNKAAIEKTVADNKAAIEKTVADNKAAIEKTVADNKAAIEGTVETLTQTVADNKADADAQIADAKVYVGTVNFGKDVNGEVEGRVLAIYDGGEQVYPQVTWNGTKSIISISEDVEAKNYEVIYVKAFTK